MKITILLKKKKKQRETERFWGCGNQQRTMAEKPVMVMAVDESEHSFYALGWALDHFFVKSGSDHPFSLVLVHARRIPASVIGVSGPGIPLQGTLQITHTYTHQPTKHL